MNWADVLQVVSGWGVPVVIAVFVASVVIMPIILISLPTDYFVRTKRTLADGGPGFLSWHSVLVLLKNISGLVLIITGIVLLVLPGQGILTILAGLMLMNFPGKYRLERWLVSHKAIAKSLNWVRQKADKPPMDFDLDSRSG